MEHRIKFYVAGMAAAFPLFVLAEIVWVGDPLLLPGGARWIDVLEGLFYLLTLPPLLWASAASASLRIAVRRPARRTRLWAAARALLVLVPALTAAALIALFKIERSLIIAAAALFGVAWIGTFVDMAFIVRHSARRLLRVIAGFAATAALLAFLFWPTPYLVTYPGLTMNMNRFAEVEGGDIKGSISGVLVFERPAFPADRLYARLFPHYEFEPIHKLGMPLSEYDELVQTMKQDANDAGSAIAFQKAGLGRGIEAQGVRITAINKGSPASGKLHAGDVIVAIDGRKVLNVVELTEATEEIAPGSEVGVTLRRGGVWQTVRTGTEPHPEDPERAAFGMTVENLLYSHIPGKVDFRRYLVHEGGPSHGNALALALLDQLTPGGITGGLKVAATGTIGKDGVIGRIGGVEQKAYTVRRSGADVFFVPAGQEDEARRGAPDLRIVPVRTLDEELAWLKANGKAPRA